MNKQDIYIPVKFSQGERVPDSYIYAPQFGWLKPLKQVYVLTDYSRRTLYEKLMNAKEFSNIGAVTKEKIFNWFEKELNIQPENKNQWD